MKSPIRKASFHQESAYNLCGIITRRDIRNMKQPTDVVSKFMTPRDKLVLHTLPHASDDFPSPEYFRDLMHLNKIEKIPVVLPNNKIIALVTLKDLNRLSTYPIANKDPEGKLYVGAAVGAKDDFIERSKALIDAGVDVLVVDIANGHS